MSCTFEFRTGAGFRSVAPAIAAVTVSLLLGATPVKAATDPGRQRADVEALASDDMAGRDNGTAGSILAQAYLIDALKAMGAVGANSAASGDDAYRQPFTDGTNIVALLPGTDLSGEYVMVGAHYDHLGSACLVPGLCNGATDNAAGVANVLAIGRAIVAQKKPVRRSVILAFWDREEDGLLGSKHYADAPLVPLADTVAYVNYDIQGANLLPGLRKSTLAIGSESGDDAFRKAVKGASGGLKLAMLSAVFGQGRSDHVNFINRVPTVFFSDATSACYHTPQDDAGIVDYGKLARQAKGGVKLVLKLVNGVRPSLRPGQPLATFDDAVLFRGLLKRAIPDVPTYFLPGDQATLYDRYDKLTTLVKEGRPAFDDADVFPMLLWAYETTQILSRANTCSSFAD